MIQQQEVHYQPYEKRIVIDYQMPSLDEYLSEETGASTCEPRGDGELLSPTEFKVLLERCVYPHAYQTIQQIFAADRTGAVGTILFNVYARARDPQTSQDINACILTIQAGRDELGAVHASTTQTAQRGRRFPNSSRQSGFHHHPAFR